jgi:hypothetical protein
VSRTLQRAPLNNYWHIGKTREGAKSVLEQIWYMDDTKQTRLAAGEWDIPGSSG